MCYVDPTSAQFTVKEALTMSQWGTSGAGCTLEGVRAIKAVARIAMTYSRWLKNDFKVPSQVASARGKCSLLHQDAIDGTLTLDAYKLDVITVMNRVLKLK